MECSQCHHQNPAGRKFCVKCGTPLPVAPAAAAPDARQCPHCAAPLRAHARFCPQCGLALEGGVSATPAPISTPVTRQHRQPARQNVAPAQPDNAQKAEPRIHAAQRVRPDDEPTLILDEVHLPDTPALAIATGKSPSLGPAGKAPAGKGSGARRRIIIGAVAVVLLIVIGVVYSRRHSAGTTAATPAPSASAPAVADLPAQAGPDGSSPAAVPEDSAPEAQAPAADSTPAAAPEEEGGDDEAPATSSSAAAPTPPAAMPAPRKSAAPVHHRATALRSRPVTPRKAPTLDDLLK